MWKADGTLGLAVSGGPDSLAMLLLAATALPGRIAAATVDHGLRPANADEALMVAAICARLNVPHAILPVKVTVGNVQAEARSARYTALASWMDDQGLAALATAHHADDQAETLLMRLNRGSGVAGLAGVRSKSTLPGSRHTLLRPLLQWRRAELAEIASAARLKPAMDPSNVDDRFDRARLRKVIASADWLDVPALAASAAHLADADASLNWAAAREWMEQVERDGPGLVWRPQAPRVIALKVLARIAAELGAEAPRGSALARTFDTLVSGQVATMADIVARPGPAGWHFSPAPRRRAQAVVKMPPSS